MALDERAWWPSDGPETSRLIRYQLQAIVDAGLIQMEVTLPGDLERAKEETQLVSIALLAPHCRQLGQHLLQCAELLERHKKPMQ